MYRMFKRLRVRFVECDLKQNEVARAAGMAPSTLCSRMQGKQPFTAWEISRIAEVLNIPREQIGEFFFEPSPKTKAG